jgi:hypothetical protein
LSVHKVAIVVHHDQKIEGFMDERIMIGILVQDSVERTVWALKSESLLNGSRLSIVKIYGLSLQGLYLYGKTPPTLSLIKVGRETNFRICTEMTSMHLQW